MDVTVQLRFTEYCRSVVMRKRPDILINYVERALESYDHTEIQEEDGRTRYYVFIKEKGEFLRVVQETTGEIHNFMWDQDFRVRSEKKLL
jgi:hypothetical protein